MVKLATPACCLVLTVLAFVQRAGEITFDTKLDLTADPLGFLARAMHLWNPQNASGELQNQAYGYFFPMGPFFAAGDIVGMPAWITQRAWSALLLCLAFYGTLRLARALNIGSEPARYVAAFGYTLAPRMLTEIGPLSSEMLPVVLLPWVMLPLVRAAAHGPRRAAGLSALAVLFMSGVNATMVLAALVLPGLWLLTRQWTREHVRLVLWWCGLVTLACLWWMIPLLLLGQYSLPFLDYIESATNTTGPLSLTNVLRGTDQWVAYIAVGEPWWPSGFALIHEPVLIVVSVLVTVLALTGLARRGLPERQFLLLAVVVGTMCIGIGYVGTLDSPLAETMRELLDGPLAPFRNVHKFEPVLRLPLMLALAYAISHLHKPVLGRAKTAVAAGLVFALAAPAWLGMLRPGPGWEEIPGYWQQALDWVAEQDPDGRTLLVPATGFGLYTWGKANDEPAQALASAPWSVRNQVPLGSAGNTRLMDAIQETLDTGLGSPALAELLDRSGYDYLLLRNDIDQQQTKAPPRTVLRQALARSAGIERVRSFGPEIELRAEDTVSAADQHTPPVPAIEIYSVAGDSPRVQATETASVPTVSGGPESLLQLIEQGLIEPDQPTLFAEDRSSDDPAWLVADGLRKRERNVGIVRRNTGPTMTIDEQPRMTRPARDIVPFTGDRHTTTAEYSGIASVTASTSRGFADAFGQPDRGQLPFAAIDGDPATAWRSSSPSGAAGQWIEVRFASAEVVSEIDVSFVKDLHVGQPVRKIRIETDVGAVDTGVADDFGPQTFGIPKGLTTRLRITVLELEDAAETGDAAISELRVPGIEPVRSLRVPMDVAPPAGVAPTFSFSRGTDVTPACFTLDDGSVRCDEEHATLGEEPLGPRRVFRSGEAALYRPELTVTPAHGGQLPGSGVSGEQEPAADGQVSARASSQLAGDPSVSAFAAIDGDPATAWVPDSRNILPSLTLQFPKERTVHKLRLHDGEFPVTSRPTEVEVSASDQRVTADVGSDGAVELPEPLEGRELRIRVTDYDPVPADERFPDAPAPVGIFQVDVNGEPVVREIDHDQQFTVDCAEGPTVRIDGDAYRVRVTGTIRQYLAGEPMRAQMCNLSDPLEEYELLPGLHHLMSSPSEQFVVRDIALIPTGNPAMNLAHRDTTVQEWGVSERAVRIEPGEEAVLALSENANAGWQATLDGRTLTPTRVDGWRQAWIVPPGQGGVVHMEFTPDDLYQIGLLVGLAAVLLLIGLTVLPDRGRPPGARPSRSSWPLWGAAGCLVLLGGWFAALVLAIGIGTALRWPRTPLVLAACGLTVASVTAFAGAIGDWAGYAYTWYAQAGWLAALAGLLATAITPAARDLVWRLSGQSPTGDNERTTELPRLT